MQKEFTKADLKDGMVVETRERGKYIVLGNRCVNSNGHNLLNNYSDDLKENKYHTAEYDIVKAFKVKTERVYRLEQLFDNDNLELIWERTETKRMTAEEMRVKLEELTGEKIEVEPSREEMVGKIKLYCSKRSCCTGCILADKCRRCNYWKFDSKKLKQCYEKVMKDGQN